MIINAVIESKDGGTLVLDFPRSIYDVYEKLQSVGIRQSPHQITLSDEEGDDVRVKLYSEDETGKHLLLTLKEQNSLADANMLAFMVDNAKPDFRSKLEQNLLNDQYSSIDNDDGTCLVGNEESKLRGMDGNRRIGDGTSIMAGPFFVCGDSGETFRSLTDEEVTRYMARFAEPEDISPEEVEADMGFMIYPM